MNDEKFTRLVEYKKFTNFKSKSTLIGMEIPSTNGKHYPLPFKKDIKLSQKYLKEMPEWFFSIGRAGTYRYLVDIKENTNIILILDAIKKSSKNNTWIKTKLIK